MNPTNEIDFDDIKSHMKLRRNLGCTIKAGRRYEQGKLTLLLMLAIVCGHSYWCCPFGVHATIRENFQG